MPVIADKKPKKRNNFFLELEIWLANTTTNISVPY